MKRYWLLPFFIALSLTAVLFLLSASPVRSSTTFVVTSTGDFWGTCPHITSCTLRTAIAWAEGGDTIRFGISGTIVITHGAGFYVDKLLTIDGSGQEIVIDAGNTTNTAFTFVAESKGSVLRNITVRGNTREWHPLIGVYASAVTIGPGVVVQSNTITGGTGVGVYGSSLITITGSETQPVVIEGNQHLGVYVGAESQALLGPGTAVERNGTGVSVASGGVVTVSGGSVAHNTDTGIYVAGSATIGPGATVLYNKDGIVVAPSVTTEPVTIFASEVASNTGFGIAIHRNNVQIGTVRVWNNMGNGIQFNKVSGGAVIASAIHDNADGGISANNASGLRIQGNVIARNKGDGISVSGSSLPITTSLTIIGNVIISNTGAGINLWGASGNIVEHNLIGLSGTVPLEGVAGPNNSGIMIAGAGRSNVVRGNIIGYNQYQNVLISGDGTEDNLLRENFIFSDACDASPRYNNSGVVVSGGAKNNTIGPGNRIACHRYSGIQVIGPGTDNNRILENRGGPVSACALWGIFGPAIACNGQGIALFNEPGNTPFPSVSPVNSTRPAGPKGTLVQNNLILSSTYDGLYAVLVTETLILSNIIQYSHGSGALLVGSTGVFSGNRVLNNRGDGLRLEPHYGLHSDGRKPETYTDDIVSQFQVLQNTFTGNGGAGIRGLDTAIDPARSLEALNSANIFGVNGQARIVQEWLGAVEVLDGNVPVSSGLVITVTAVPGTCGTSYSLQTHNNGAWGPSNNGLGYGSFQLDHVGTWALILGDYVDNGGKYWNCNPYSVQVSGALRGSASFSFDGNASTHPVDPDLGIPYSRPVQNVNGRYQVAQVRFLRVFLPLVLRSFRP